MFPFLEVNRAVGARELGLDRFAEGGVQHRDPELLVKDWGLGLGDGDGLAFRPAELDLHDRCGLRMEWSSVVFVTGPSRSSRFCCQRGLDLAMV